MRVLIVDDEPNVCERLAILASRRLISHVVIVAGYEEFAYAREALRQGAFGGAGGIAAVVTPMNGGSRLRNLARLAARDVRGSAHPDPVVVWEDGASGEAGAADGILAASVLRSVQALRRTHAQ